MSDQPMFEARSSRDSSSPSSDTSLDAFVAAVRSAHAGGAAASRMTRGARPGVTALLIGNTPKERGRAAERVADAAEASVMRVDISDIVSKYVGETEQNVDAVFDRARIAGAVLLFDEADALFGKRTDVKDSHDRYANIELSYLIERIASYGGVAILATNRRENIDPAFVRRLRYVVVLPPG